MSQYEEQPDDDLTDQERAALATFAQIEAEEKGTAHVDPDDQQPEAAAAEQPASEGDADAAAVTADGTGDVQPAAAAEPDPAAQPAAEQPQEPVAVQPQSAPILIANAPEDAEAKLAEIATKKEALADQYEAGEITLKDMQKQVDALSEQALDIKMQVREAELAQKLEQQRLNNEWQAECNAFTRDHPEYKTGGPQYDEARTALLDASLRSIAMIPGQKYTNAEALVKAHAMVKGAYGETVAAQAPQPAAKPKLVSVPKPEAPPNIANLPAASMNDTNGGEFAALDRLAKSDLDAYEEAMANLTDAQRARYLRA